MLLLAYAPAVRCPVQITRVCRSRYAFAMRCPVLTWRNVPGRDTCTLCDDLHATPPAPVSPYALARQCPVQTSRTFCICLRACYAMSGTDLAYAATSLASSSALTGSTLPYRPTRLLRDMHY
eukprot:1483226-Rhodomonas_salina.3